MELDLDRSTVTLAGETFPAVVVVCPPHRDDPQGSRSDWSRSLCVIDEEGVADWIFIPFENGTALQIDLHPRPEEPGLLMLWWCDPWHTELCDFSDGPSWLPQFFDPFWDRAEEAWTVELLHRLARRPRPAPPADGPSCELRRLADAPVRA